MRIEKGGHNNRMARVLTLLYHRVINLKYDKNLLAVTPDNFYRQMMFLKKNYPIVRFEQDWKDLNNDAVCITFDDGYFDNFINALPILKEMDIPATVFVTTGNIDSTREFWWDELERILLDTQRVYQKVFKLDDEMFSCQWSTQSFDDREELYATLHWLMHDKITVDKREEWMSQLREWSNAGTMGRMQNQGMQINRIERIPQLLTIGAHTVNHPSLRNLSVQEQEYEICQSIQQLEKMLQRKITTFSYPFGTENDFDEIAVEICKREKIHKAASCISGIWKPGDDEYRIPRKIVRNWDIDEYARKIEEYWNYSK